MANNIWQAGNEHKLELITKEMIEEAEKINLI